VKEQVSHLHKATGKITVLQILMYMFYRRDGKVKDPCCNYKVICCIIVLVNILMSTDSVCTCSEEYIKHFSIVSHNCVTGIQDIRLLASAID
jgi:hypothetical protein